jgi:transcriptional regulator with XRE-family HTH domain
MEMNSDEGVTYSPSGGDHVVWLQGVQAPDSCTLPAAISPFPAVAATLILGTALCVGAEAIAGQMPHFGTSPLVEDQRPVVEERAATGPVQRTTTYRRLLVGSFAEQARGVMAALALTKAQLAGVLGVTRPTVYEWLGGKEPSPGKAARLTLILRLLARAGVSGEKPLNARFVRHATNERGSSLLAMLCAAELDQDEIEKSIREARDLGEEAESHRMKREGRLRARGFEDPTEEQRRDNLNNVVAMLDWPK